VILFFDLWFEIDAEDYLEKKMAYADGCSSFYPCYLAASNWENSMILSVSVQMYRMAAFRATPPNMALHQ